MELSRQKKTIGGTTRPTDQPLQAVGRGDSCQAGLLYECSHDFRTPLTLVADPVEQLLEDKDLTLSNDPY